MKVAAASAVALGENGGINTDKNSRFGFVRAVRIRVKNMSSMDMSRDGWGSRVKRRPTPYKHQQLCFLSQHVGRHDTTRNIITININRQRQCSRYKHSMFSFWYVLIFNTQHSTRAVRVKGKNLLSAHSWNHSSSLGSSLKSPVFKSRSSPLNLSPVPRKVPKAKFKFGIKNAALWLQLCKTELTVLDKFDEQETRSIN